jgi:PAS domain S-box-containing protein
MTDPKRQGWTVFDQPGGQRLKIAFFISVIAAGGLYLTSLYNYLLFHTLVELFSIAIGWSMFVLVWNARRWMNNPYLYGLGVALAAAGCIDLVHTLAYKGMNLFPGYDSNLPTQLWIAARYLQSLSMLFAAVWLIDLPTVISRIGGENEKATSRLEYGLVLVYIGITISLIILIFARLFPLCYVEGKGLTPFKKISEYVISLILVASLVVLWKKRQYFDRSLLLLIMAATVATVLSELAFTFYVGVYDFSNLVGHFAKLAAFSLIYLAVIQAGLQRPYGLLFKNLSQQADALRESDSRMQNAFEYAPIGMAWVSPQGHFLKVNPAVCRLLGYRAQELLGMTFQEITHPDDLEADLTLLTQTLAGEIPSYRLEKRYIDKNGNLVWALLSVSLVRDEHGQPLHFISQIIDITERKQWEAALRQERSALETRVQERTIELSQANASLMHALRVKDEFMASMSHELRTPLTGILGLTEVIRAGIYGKYDERMEKPLRNIEESGQHLLSLINDILDLSKAEARMIKLEMSPVSVMSVVQSSLRMVQESAQKKQISIAMNMETGVEVLEVDERRLKQILVNLLSNAVKFTGVRGKVGIDVVGKPGRDQMDFVVWDTGIGIDPNDMNRLFVPFVQLDSRLDRQYSGTGLGLALVYRLVELHGGSIQVESQPGVGSRFTVSLPWRNVHNFSGGSEFNRPCSPALLSPGEREFQDKNPVQFPVCLIAEDNEITLGMLRDFLTGNGYQVYEARDGAEAVQQAKDLRPDVILMDIQMPVMDGIAATRNLREDSELKNTLIIALTALAMVGDRERCLEAGVDEYLSKPVNLGELECILHDRFKQKGRFAR